MAPREVVEGVAHPLVELAPALAARDDEVGVDLADAREGAGIDLVDLGVGHALARAECALAKARIGQDLQADALADATRRLHGPPEVGGDERVDALGNEARGDRFGLRDSVLGELAVALALDAHLDVPARLAVPHDDENGATYHFRRIPDLSRDHENGTWHHFFKRASSFRP